MTCQALCVVIQSVMLNGFVRIMAGGATDAEVVRIVAGAVSGSVGMKADVADASRTRQLNLLPASMAIASELLREIIGAQTRRIKNALVFSLFRVARFGQRDVIGAGPVTGFAGDARRHLVQLKFGLTDRGLCVTAEAVFRIRRLHQTAEGFF